MYRNQAGLGGEGERVNLPHVIIALALQAIGFTIYHWISPVWLTAYGAILWYLSRELTQAEYRWIRAYGAGKRANLPWWGMFDRRVWDVKSACDWLVPTAIVTAVALFLC